MEKLGEVKLKKGIGAIAYEGEVYVKHCGVFGRGVCHGGVIECCDRTVEDEMAEVWIMER